MITDKIVSIRVWGGNINHFKSLGYEIKSGEILNIPLEHLSKNSHYRINCLCDVCKNKRSTTYQDYILKTNQDGKYYCSECMKEKRIKNVKIKYGVENVFQLNDIKNQSKKTRFEKYGDVNYRNNEKREETILEKYGYINVFQNEDVKNKIKETNLKKYKVEYPIQNENIKLKSKETCFKNHGVEQSQQNSIIFNKSRINSLLFKKYKNTNLYYQGTYEYDFLNLCESLNILEQISKPKSILYIFNDKKKYYHPDFYIEKLNLIIEIKSDYWYNIHKERNEIKIKRMKELNNNFIMIMNKDYDEFLKIIY